MQMRVNSVVLKPLINFYKKYKIIIHAVWVSPTLFAFAIFCAGAGHGVLGPYVFLYPHVALLSLYFDEREYDVLFSYSDLLLYVIYGIVLHLSKKKNQDRLAIMIILITHVILALRYYSLLSPASFR